jgi:predicted lysophospholipase L1 biosynthesis ABC-type transport system permease subunit
VLRVRLLTDAEAHAFERGHAAWIEQADPRRKGAGPLVPLRVVGVEALLDDGDLVGQLLASPSFARKYGEYFSMAVPYLAVRLAHSASGFPAFANEVAALYPKSATVGAASEAPFRVPTVDAITLQATTLWFVAAAAWVIAFVGVAPALARRMDRESPERETLRVLGLPSTSLFAASLVGPVVVSLGAGALAFAFGLAVSPLTAVGVSAPFDPASGIFVDGLVLAGGAASVVVSLLVVGAVLAARRVAQTGAERTVHAGGERRLDPGLTRLGVPIALGIRSALSGGTGRLRVPTASTLAAIVAMFSLVTAALVVAASSTRLLETPRLYGQNFQLLGEVGGLPPAVGVRVSRVVQDDRAIAAATAAAVATVTIEGHSIGLLGTRPLKNSVPLSLVDGRFPSNSREIVLGRHTMAALGLRVGDSVQVRGRSGGVSMRVVGEATLPSVVWDAQGVTVGDGAVVTLNRLMSLAPGTSVSRFLVRLAPGVASERERLALIRRTGTNFDLSLRPAVVGKLTHVRGVPYALAALVAAAAVAALAHLLVATTRRRRREVAILKTLGLRRRDVGATVYVQSATTVAIGCLVGIPLGVVVGERVWDALANRLGVVPEPVLPLAPIALLVPAALVVCAVVAAVPAALAARIPAAAVLRAE